MTYHINRIAKATTAIAAVLAFSSTPLLAQEAAPPDPVADTSVEPVAPADPLAPEPTASETATPPAPQPKVEKTTTTKTTTTTQRTTRTAARSPARSPARSVARSTAAAAPAAAAPAPAAEAPAPVPLPAETQPPAMAVPPPPPPVAEPAPASTDTSTFDLTSPDALPIVGAGALGLLVLGGAGFVAHRRKRRREDAEFEARQQALAAIDEEQALELGSAEEIQPAPAFARTPMHDPVPATGVWTNIPAQGSWRPAADTDFMFRRAGEDAKTPVEQD